MDDSVKPPFYEMNLTEQNLALVIGDSLFEYIPNQSSIINIDGEDLLQVRYEHDPKTGSIFPSLSARLYDKNGNKLLEIDDNEIAFSRTVHDIKTQGRMISVYTANNEYGAELKIAPSSRVELQRLHMSYKGIEMLFDGNFAVRNPHEADSVQGSAGGACGCSMMRPMWRSPS